jgi:CspA family cold shock protein
MTGKVKFFNEAKGFGFIKEDGTGKEYFVHATGFLDQVKSDEAVTFDIEEGQRGPKAINVMRKRK